jgi:antitoxin (DNA-binding transcriptional repressor) of toxin-antitoxin stability system
MHQAKSRLSQLVELALAGEDVVSTHNGEQVVQPVAIDDQVEASLRPIGLGRAVEPLIFDSEYKLMSDTNPDDPLNQP